MFGRKARKQAEQEALQRMMEEAEANRRAAQEAEEATRVAEAEHENKFYYDSEIIFDDDEFTEENGFDYQDDVQEPIKEETAPVDTGFVALPVHEDKPEENVSEPVVEKTEDAVQEPTQANTKEEDSSTFEQEENDNEQETEIRYVVDGPTEDDEIVKPAKLVKLPNLIDYMLTLKMSKKMKMNIATLLLGAYAKYKDIPAEKEIIIGCMKKIMFALMNS